MVVAGLAQFCISSKIVGMNFQFQKEENIENELGMMNMVGTSFAQSCISPKTVETISTVEKKKRLKMCLVW